jgi:putative ABC transport system ATP-binding protein
MIHCQSVEKQFMAPDRPDPLRWAVDAFTVERGERVLITGHSGCGKTTMLNLLAGLLTPDAGTITVDGVRVDELTTSDADRFRGQHVGLIFQSFQLLTPLTVLDNLLLGARYGRKWEAREARQRAETLLNEVGLQHRMQYRPGRLSIGEQQRVAIARALINEPPLLLADEPTASLDAANAERVLDLLFRVCAKHGTTLVAVSHAAEIAARFDRVVDASSWMRATAQEVPHV